MNLPTEILSIINSYLESDLYKEFIEIAEVRNNKFGFYIHWTEFKCKVNLSIFVKMFLEYNIKNLVIGEICCSGAGIKINNL